MKCDDDAVTSHDVSDATVRRRDTTRVTRSVVNPSRHSPAPPTDHSYLMLGSTTQRHSRPQAVELVSYQTTVVG